jgi:outer membrane protein OmpA-like peptidoglycan-associated protein
MLTRFVTKNKAAILFTGVTLLGISLSLAGGRSPRPIRQEEKFSVNTKRPILIPARKTTLPFIVFGDDPKKTTPYIPSGYMGDSDSLKLFSAYESAPLASGGQGRTSYRITYSGRGSEGWAGIYWLAPANNWGTVKGAGYNLTEATRVTFWIRGEKGGERLSEVSVGGIASGSYPDSDRASIGPLTLSDKWEQYAIDLRGKDLRHIIGGFAFSIKREDNVRGARFYLDEIVYEGGEPSTSTVKSGPDAVETPAPLAYESIKKIVPFDTAKHGFGNEAIAVLDEVLKISRESEKCTVIVEGHADTVGSSDFNMQLSEDRARSVADYLVANGMSRDIVTVKGYGETRPLLSENDYPDIARRKNRRVEVRVEITIQSPAAEK